MKKLVEENLNEYEKLRTVEDLIDGFGEEYVLFVKHDGKYKILTTSETLVELITNLKDILKSGNFQ